MPTYKSVVLQPGESYVLPNGSNLMYVSNSNIYTSDGNCAPAPTAGSTCYTFYPPIPTKDIDVPNDSDASAEFFITGFVFDGIEVPISRTYAVYGGLSTCVQSTGGESTTNYVERLCKNLWYQLASVSNGSVIFGIKVVYSDYVDGDVVQIIVNIPNIFTEVKMKMIDAYQNDPLGIGAPFYVQGIVNQGCTPFDNYDTIWTLGNFASSN
jgi:hypothetical protein